MTGLMMRSTSAITKGGLILPELTYSIRNNCQIGQWVQSDGETTITNELSFCIVHLEQMYGDLGKTKGAHWVQLWGISDQVLKGQVVFCTYIKGRSLNLLGNKVLEAHIAEKGASDLLFKSKFIRQTNDYGVYYILGFETEELPAKDPKRKRIDDFLATNPIFLDKNIPPTLFATSDMTPEACAEYLKLIRAELKPPKA
ncbi:MAG: hypothetical protein VKL42_12495 [Snowella sp.]|nr:hypothetical protein [Snowella sp.]